MAVSNEEIKDSVLDKFRDFLHRLVDKHSRRKHWNNTPFVKEILSQFSHGFELRDESVGRWYATPEAADWNNEINSEQVGVRFLLTRSPQPVPDKIHSGTLQKPKRVIRDFGEPQSGGEAFILFYTFTDSLSFEENLQFFREFAISQIKDIQIDPDSRTSSLIEAGRSSATVL